mgnify:CR=1 FL=1
MALTPQFGTIVPSQTQEVLQSNYLQWTDAGAANFADFAQQYLPEIYEQEVERYGNRTLSGFLRMVGAELPMTSDQVIWSEQNRLHIAYDGCTVAGNVINVNPTGAADINNVISARATVVIMDDFGAEVKALVSISDPGAGTITVEPYTAATIAGAGLVGNVKYLFTVLNMQKDQLLLTLYQDLVLLQLLQMDNTLVLTLHLLNSKTILSSLETNMLLMVLIWLKSVG